jgi:hypothetical protein
MEPLCHHDRPCLRRHPVSLFVLDDLALVCVARICRKARKDRARTRADSIRV